MDGAIMRKTIAVLAFIVAGCGSNPVPAPVDFENNAIKTAASLAYEAGVVKGMCDVLKDIKPKKYAKFKDQCEAYDFEAFWARFKDELDKKTKETE